MGRPRGLVAPGPAQSSVSVRNQDTNVMCDVVCEEDDPCLFTVYCGPHQGLEQFTCSLTFCGGLFVDTEQGLLEFDSVQ